MPECEVYRETYAVIVQLISETAKFCKQKWFNKYKYAYELKLNGCCLRCGWFSDIFWIFFLHFQRMTQQFKKKNFFNLKIYIEVLRSEQPMTKILLELIFISNFHCIQQLPNSKLLIEHEIRMRVIKRLSKHMWMKYGIIMTI